MDNEMNRKNRIAIDARELTKENLNSLGYILLIVLKYLSGYEVFLYSDIGIPQKYIPPKAKVISREQKYTGGTDLYKFQYWMKQRMKEDGIDILFQINHFSVIPTKNIKQIVVIHDLYPLESIEKQDFKSRSVYRISLFLTMLFADRIFTVSNFTKGRLEHFFWKSAKVKVNYNGIDDPLILDDPEAYHCVNGPFFLMLGRVNYWKGTLRVVKLYERYFRESNYKLVIAGQAASPEIKAVLYRYISNNQNIIWLDYVTNETKEWLLQNCSLFIYSSRYDGFGLPPLEAAIRKKKVLINDIEVLREVSKNCGHYVDFYSDDYKVTDAIHQEIMDDSEERINEMYEVAKSYTWDRYGETIVREIESGNAESN